MVRRPTPSWPDPAATLAAMNGTMARSGSSAPCVQWNSILAIFVAPHSRQRAAPGHLPRYAACRSRLPRCRRFGSHYLAGTTLAQGASMTRTRMVVVGGEGAGMSAASQARRRRPAEDLAIVAFERGPHTSYSACGLPYYASGMVGDWERLVVRTPEQFAQQDIDARVRHQVEEIDLDAGRVRVHDLEQGRSFDEPWDVLGVATGSEPVRPPVPGLDLAGVYGLSILQDGLAPPDRES